MGTGRKYRKTSMTRPVKGACDRRRRVKTQRARLVALGMDEAVVKKLNIKEVRVLLQRPLKISATS